jgi:hypothetical protein
MCAFPFFAVVFRIRAVDFGRFCDAGGLDRGTGVVDNTGIVVRWARRLDVVEGRLEVFELATVRALVFFLSNSHVYQLT